jgi:signal transduction histidine kinase
MEFLRGLINGMRCGIVAIDRDGRLAMINRVAQQILDLDEAPQPGTPIVDALARHPRVARVLCESFDMVSLPNRAELELGPEESFEKTIGFTLSMIPSASGEAHGAAIFFKDLTQIEHKEEQERLKDRLAALGEMAASLAHEIRNPLAAIDVSCKLLGRRLKAANPEDGSNQELLDKITAEVRRLNSTITSSLEFVRPLKLLSERAELLAMLDDAIDVARERANQPSVHVERRYPEALPSFLMDRGQLRQVFENLCINAIEAMGTEGVLTVEVEALTAPSATSIPYPMGEERVRDPWHHFEQFAVVRISDTGPGIGSDERDRIFYPFFTTKKQGSGVGLSMAKKIVASHRGLIDVDDAPGGGAQFTVRLPMILEEAEV